MTITWIYSIERLPINDFKTSRLAFYPKQGNKIEGVVLNRVCILEIHFWKQGPTYEKEGPDPIKASNQQ